MLRIILAALFLPAVAVAQPAAKQPPMEITLVRGAGPACEPDCPQWIAAQGEIRAETPARLRRVLATLKGRKVPLLLHSPGGNVDAGIAMGRMIREAGLSVSVAKTSLPEPCAPRDAACQRERRARPTQADFTFRNALCASACTYVLAGGTARVLHPASHVGVHQITHFTTTNQVRRLYRVERRRINGRWVETRRVLVAERVVASSTRKSATPPEASIAKIGRHFAAMGIAPELHALANATPPEQMRFLDENERLRLGLATTGAAAEVLTGLGFDRDNPFFAAAGAQAAYTGYASAGTFEGASAMLEYSGVTERARAANPLSIRILQGQKPAQLTGLFLKLRLPDGTAAEGVRAAEDPPDTLRLDLSRARLCALRASDPLVLTAQRGTQASASPALNLNRRAIDLMPLSGIQGVLCRQNRWER